MFLLKSIFNKVLSWFGVERDAPMQTEPTQEEIAYSRAPKRKYKSFFTSEDGRKLSFPQSFSELLDNLDKTFKFMKLPVEYSALSADERVGLTRLGIYVPHPWFIPHPEYMIKHKELNITKLDTFPSIMCVAFPHDFESENKAERYSPHMFFAIKVDKLPLGVQPLKGVAYKAGMAFSIKGKTSWHFMYMVINSHTGEINFCRELQHVPQGKNDYAYLQKITKLPVLLEPDPEHARTVEESIAFNKAVFKQVFEWWVSRKDESWSVAVKNNKQRVTFSIGRTETKRYFADRDKTVLNAKGKPAKIIHYVSEHTRVVKGRKALVREHLRGADRFSWKGYDCIVSAPKFSQLGTVSLEASAVLDDGENVIDMRKYISTSQMVSKITEIEERKVK
jgi:hypothetical protein